VRPYRLKPGFGVLGRLGRDLFLAQCHGGGPPLPRCRRSSFIFNGLHWSSTAFTVLCFVLRTFFVLYDVIDFSSVLLWPVLCREGRYNGSDCSNTSMGSTQTFTFNYFNITISACDEARIYSCCLQYGETFLLYAVLLNSW